MPVACPSCCPACPTPDPWEAPSCPVPWVTVAREELCPGSWVHRIDVSRGCGLRFQKALLSKKSCPFSYWYSWLPPVSSVKWILRPTLAITSFVLIPYVSCSVFSFLLLRTSDLRQQQGLWMHREARGEGRKGGWEPDRCAKDRDSCGLLAVWTWPLPAGAAHSQASEAGRVSASRLELSSRKSLTFHHPQGKSGLPITFNCQSKPRECAPFSLFLGKWYPFLCSHSKSALVFFLKVAIWEGGFI